MKRLFIILILLPLASCIKELDWPNTLAPADPIGYGTLVIFTDWIAMDNNCQSFDVTLDGNFIGQITQRTPDAYCYEQFAITIDSVVEGEHTIYAGQCDTVSWNLNKDIFADQCNVVKLSK